MNFVMPRLPFVFAALASLALVPPARGGDEGDGHRSLFLAAAAALVAGRKADFERRRQALDGYVLAPYLDHAALRRELPDLDPVRARRFLEREQGHQLGVQFLREWLLELGRRGDWRSVLAFDDATVATSIQHRCLRLRAQIATGGDEDVIRPLVLELWANGNSLPKTCDAVLAHGRERDWIGPREIRQRLRLAVRAGNGSLAGYLARQLPVSQREHGERLARALTDPEATLKAAATWPDQAAHREAAAWALRLRARQSIDDAIGHWQLLKSRFGFEPDEHHGILRELALYAAVAYREDADDWFRQVPASLHDEQLLEWQLRVALARLDWPAVRELTAQQAESAPSDTPRMRYWHARALLELGQRQAAGLLFQALAGEAHYHGFLAADRIGTAYPLCPLEVESDPERESRLSSNVELLRALELHAVGWYHQAAHSWEHALRDASREDRLLAVRLADRQGWYDRAAFNLRGEDELRYYSLRFPLAERELIEREARANDLDSAWVYALIRAESAWQPHARSHANAHGLMQLLPATGQRMARELGLSWTGTSALLEPTTNIRLGTRYLARQAERFEHSPWIASAAYNAGPTPVERWLEQRGHLPADVFIETIPYHETRAYVPRILAFSVIYDWRLHGKARPLSSRLPDPGQRYAGVPSLQQARPFTCHRDEHHGEAIGATGDRPVFDQSLSTDAESTP